MSLSGLLGKTNLDKLQLHLETPAETYDGQPTLARLQVRNRKRWLPTFLMAIEIEGGHAFLCALPRGKTTELPLDLCLTGRGWKHLRQARLRSHFPVDFFIRTRTLKLDQQLLILPRPRPVSSSELPGEATGAGEAPRSASRGGSEGELVSVADYSGSEPRKQIHWKLSARQDELKVKLFGPLLAPPVVIDPATLPGRDLETRLGEAAWLINHYSRQGRALSLRLPGGTLLGSSPGSGRLKLLTELALYDEA